HRHLLALHALQHSEAEGAFRVGQQAVEGFFNCFGSLPGHDVCGPGARPVTPVDPGARLLVDACQGIRVLAAAGRIGRGAQTLESASVLAMRSRSSMAAGPLRRAMIQTAWSRPRAPMPSLLSASARALEPSRPRRSIAAWASQRLE